ncbi:hypothetical protein LJR230_002408 [Trinickia sp. LjRoot230]|uniref:hypothetical protein n=1 Tax=Trinickia sp. LjRoot230 TaxID=3342288 RepID=UPI003ED16FA7
MASAERPHLIGPAASARLLHLRFPVDRFAPLPRCVPALRYIYAAFPRGARARAIREALLAGDKTKLLALEKEQAKKDRSLLYAKILGVELTDIDQAGVNGQPAPIEWKPLDVFAPPEELFESLDIATDFYGSCSYTDSATRFAATLITKMRMLKPGGVLIGVNEAVTGFWKGYGAALPGANVPPHLMRAIMRILDPNAELESLALDTSTTDDHVPAVVVMSVLQKSADFEKRLPEIRQQLVDLLSLPDSINLEGMAPPRAFAQTRDEMANNAIIPIGSVCVSEDGPPTLLALMRDKYGLRQVHAFENYAGHLDPTDATPVTIRPSSVVHAECEPSGSGWGSTVDHRGVVTLHDFFVGDEIAIEPFSQKGDRQLGPWSPDGKHFIVTSRSVDEDTDLPVTEIYVVDVDHPDQPRLLVRENDADWTQTTNHGDGTFIPSLEGAQRGRSLLWTEQGSLLAVRRREGQSDEIWEIDPSTGERRCLVGPDVAHARLRWNQYPDDDRNTPDAPAPDARYEPLDPDALLRIDQLYASPEQPGFGLSVLLPGERQAHASWFVPASNDETPEPAKLLLQYQSTTVGRVTRDDGSTLLVPATGIPSLITGGKSIRLNNPYAGPYASNSFRGYGDPTHLGRPVSLGDTFVLPIVSPSRGPSVARVDVERVVKTQKTSSTYELLQPTDETAVETWRVSYPDPDGRVAFAGPDIGRLLLPSAKARKTMTGPLPVLVWLDGRGATFHPGWMQRLVERCGVAVLVPHLDGAGEGDDSTSTRQRREDAVAQLHRHIEALRTPSARDDDPIRLLDGTRMMVAGGPLVMDLLAAHPDDAIAAAVVAQRDEPVLRDADDLAYQGPLLVAGNNQQINAIAPAAEQLRANGRQVVTVRAANERGTGRFESTDNESALRLIISTFFQKAAGARSAGDPKEIIPGNAWTLEKPTQWDRLRVNPLEPHPKQPRLRPLSGKVAPRLTRGVVASVEPKSDTTGTAHEIKVKTRKPLYSSMTVDVDMTNKRAVVVDITNPPDLNSVGIWSEMIAAAIAQYDIKEIEFQPVPTVAFTTLHTPKEYFITEVLASAFNRRGVNRANLWQQIKPTPGDLNRRLTVAVRTGPARKKE